MQKKLGDQHICTQHHSSKCAAFAVVNTVNTSRLNLRPDLGSNPKASSLRWSLLSRSAKCISLVWFFWIQKCLLLEKKHLLVENPIVLLPKWHFYWYRSFLSHPLSCGRFSKTLLRTSELEIEPESPESKLMNCHWSILTDFYMIKYPGWKVSRLWLYYPIYWLNRTWLKISRLIYTLINNHDSPTWKRPGRLWTATAMWPGASVRSLFLYNLPRPSAL